MINSHIFREYDIRGIVEDDFSDENVELIGKGIGTFFKKRGAKTLGIGRDGRKSSEHLRKVLISGVTSTGVSVVDFGLTLTPALYYGSLDLDGGVMITGSHNPVTHNGFKIIGKNHTPVYGDDIQRILEIIKDKKFSEGEGDVKEEEILEKYKDAITSRLSLNKKLKVVVDSANGVAGLVLPNVWEALGCDVICLNRDIDGTFPSHTPDTIRPEFYSDLKNKVVETGADIGVGYDGDADRCGVVDDKGNIIAMDRILVLLVKEILQKKPESEIIFDVRCSQVLPEEIEKLGGKPILWKVGNSPIKAKMEEIGAEFAGELVGHIMYKEFFNMDDGIYVSGRILQILSREKKKLSQLDAEIPKYFASEEVHVSVPDEIKFGLIDDLVNDFKKEYEVIDVDGARVEFGDGWGLVRASNTNAQIKLRFESKDMKRLEAIMHIFKEKLGGYSGVEFSDEDFENALPT